MTVMLFSSPGSANLALPMRGICNKGKRMDISGHPTTSGSSHLLKGVSLGSGASAATLNDRNPVSAIEKLKRAPDPHSTFDDPSRAWSVDAK